MSQLVEYGHVRMGPGADWAGTTLTMLSLLLSKDQTTSSRSTLPGRSLDSPVRDTMGTRLTNRYSPRPLIIQGAGAGADVTAMGVTVGVVPYTGLNQNLYANHVVGHASSLRETGYCPNHRLDPNDSSQEVLGKKRRISEVALRRKGPKGSIPQMHICNHTQAHDRQRSCPSVISIIRNKCYLLSDTYSSTRLLNSLISSAEVLQHPPTIRPSHKPLSSTLMTTSIILSAHS